jgi:hypothetical protein
MAHKGFARDDEKLPASHLSAGSKNLPNPLKCIDVNHAAVFFLRSAQRFFIARPIFLRAAADRCRLWTLRLPALPKLA